jgi:hypothetical protein
VLARPVAVGGDHRQLIAFRRTHHHTDPLCHGPHPPRPWPSIAYLAIMNHLNESMH